MKATDGRSGEAFQQNAWISPSYGTLPTCCSMIYRFTLKKWCLIFCDFKLLAINRRVFWYGQIVGMMSLSEVIQVMMSLLSRDMCLLSPYLRVFVWPWWLWKSVPCYTETRDDTFGVWWSHQPTRHLQLCVWDTSNDEMFGTVCLRMIC